MELTTKTFSEGLNFLIDCYGNLANWHNNKFPYITWYEVIKSVIPDEEFLPSIKMYCTANPKPTCPADIINFYIKVIKP